MNRRSRLLVWLLPLAVSLVVGVWPLHVGATSTRHGAAVPAHNDANTLTIVTCCGMPAGFTKASMSGTSSESAFYRYYHTLWAKRFPGLTIKEVDVSSYNDLVAKTILGVNAGNPPDIIATQGQLGLLVARHAVQNLDTFYQRAHIAPSLFVPALANWARIKGHWYAMPENSNPSMGEILYFPQLVKAAGWDPNNIPRTWAQLWTATRKVTRWDRSGALARIGLPVNAPSAIEINLFCGYFATYDTHSGRFHANLPCIKDYFRYEQRLLTFYGGVAKYTKFTSGDPGVFSCSKKAYYTAGKILFPIDAYWSGTQTDTCYGLPWKLAPPPTPHGTRAERRAVSTTAQQIEIPTGAKHAQLAWDFVKFTFWDHGNLQGPLTDGYAVAAQAGAWAHSLVTAEQRIREHNHYPGNPVAAAIPLVMQDAALGQVFLPTDVASPNYDTLMAQAWQQIEYGRASVDQALDRAQQLIDTQQRALHAQFGM